jgi:hypothetical protein
MFGTDVPGSPFSHDRADAGAGDLSAVACSQHVARTDEVRKNEAARIMTSGLGS